ncbi:MAG: radical SAM protein, partial [Treponemataceae bacterium]|nr:radical SAM protein [Treponemataceae bacterium]
MTEKPTIHFETLGCKLNQIESESAARCFEDAGFGIHMEPVSGSTTPDNSVILCIVNTCTVTTKAEQKARRIIRLLQDIYPQAVTLVTGCYAEVEPAAIAKLASHVVVLPGTAKDTLAGIPAQLKKAVEQPADKDVVVKALTSFITLKPVQNSTFTLATDTFYHHSRSSIKIQDGCNNACAYCRIHLARGNAVSLDPETVLERVVNLEKNGQKEVVLTGVNLTQYKSDLNGVAVDFADLLKYLLDNTSSIHFRISSLYPERVDDALCSVICHSRVRPHFHLSVQSGSDAVLRNMRRVYNRQQVIDACNRLRAVKPDCF